MISLVSSDSRDDLTYISKLAYDTSHVGSLEVSSDGRTAALRIEVTMVLSRVSIGKPLRCHHRKHSHGTDAENEHETDLLLKRNLQFHHHGDGKYEKDHVGDDVGSRSRDV